MTNTVLIILGGCLLGALQLVVGVAIGWWLRRPAPGSRDVDLGRARSLALELHGLTQSIGMRVADHRSRFEAASARLQEAPADKHHPTTDLVVGVVGEILAANRQLQEELHAAEDQIAEQAREIESHLTTSLTDPLTRLPNRRALDEQLATRLGDYRKHGTPFSVVMVDVDHFKQINDDFGHQMGDDVLVSLAGALRTSLRRHDFVGRYGGEEFAIVLPHTTLDEGHHAVAKAQEALRMLSDQFQQLERPITASAGIASIEPGEEVSTLVKRADEALYAAKHNGRNCTWIHDGAECLPLDEQLAAEPTWQAPANEDTEGNESASQPLSAAMAGACDDLRAAMTSTVSE
ncbi:GGDEF domain-containing protein [Aeoliella sp.]|uniref:GGDEF domain-containing protein n=1 Tax=Aeoliella sp. TaxID=2795800 RepID=UPI003CCC2C77